MALKSEYVKKSLLKNLKEGGDSQNIIFGAEVCEICARFIRNHFEVQAADHILSMSLNFKPIYSKQRFIVSAYVKGKDGILRPSRPVRCTSDDANDQCCIKFNGFRPRQTGTKAPLASSSRQLDPSSLIRQGPFLGSLNW